MPPPPPPQHEPNPKMMEEEQPQAHPLPHSHNHSASSTLSSPYEVVMADLQRRGHGDLAHEIAKIAITGTTTTAIAAEKEGPGQVASDETDNETLEEIAQETHMEVVDHKCQQDERHKVAKAHTGVGVGVAVGVAVGVPTTTTTLTSTKGKAKPTAAPTDEDDDDRNQNAWHVGLASTSHADSKQQQPSQQSHQLPHRQQEEEHGIMPVPPTRLVRNSGTNGSRSRASAPGAFHVEPANSTNNISNTDNPSLMEEGGGSLHGSEFALHNGSSASSTATNTPCTSSSDPLSSMLELEAVRVDDIMTVKAEPLDDEQRAKRLLFLKALACVTVALVVIVTVLATTLTSQQQRTTNVAEEATPPPTYHPDARFQLLQDLLLDALTPLYNLNEHTTTPAILQQAWANASTPQHQALLWMAYNDTELAKIPQPFLEPNVDYMDNSDSFWDYPLTTNNSVSENTTDSNNNNAILQQDESITNTNTNSKPFQLRDRILQRYVLAVLYFSWGGSTNSWTESYEFLSAGHECDWSGALQCTSSGGSAVTHVDLRNNNLTGTLPLEMAALTQLQSINLATNHLVGTLPPAWSALTDLTVLDLGFNKFTGTIPVEYYQHWTQMEQWILSESDLTGTIASDIGYLGPSLKILAWERNELHGAIPPEFWHSLTNLEEFDLSQQSQKFENETIGTEIGRWSNLRSLIFHGLELRGSIPSELGLLTKLSRLQIASNHLSGTIPSELGLLTELTRLSLSLNAITGTVPTDLVQLTMMERLYLQNTLLTGDVGFLCEAIDDGIMLPMDPLRVDMQEVSGCYCCTCCEY